ncbi:MAG: hypothetical protein WD355_01195 [Balneolaceae bacterium]
MYFKLLLPFLIVLYSSCQPVPGDSWEADAELVQQMEEERPDYLWSESDVPEYTLPDPLQKMDGTAIRTADEWLSNRNNLLELFRTEMYGRMPGLADMTWFTVVTEDEAAMDGEATLRRITIHNVVDDREHSFELTLFLPNRVEGPTPVFLLMNNRSAENTDPDRETRSGFWPAEEVIARGYGIAAIQNGDLAPDDEETYTEGIIRLFEGDRASGVRATDAGKALAAWGWGASRAMDYLESDEEVDASKVALIGHSRGGKASLWAGAEDSRFSLVISNESGSGGAALSRRQYGETIRAVNRFTHWFAENFQTWNGREQELPFDQHMLVSLIAPRAVYIASADEDLWADPKGEFLSLVHSSPVYRLWGHSAIRPEEMPALEEPFRSGPRGYHVRRGTHNLTPLDWNLFIDFAETVWP